MTKYNLTLSLLQALRKEFNDLQISNSESCIYINSLKFEKLLVTIDYIALWQYSINCHCDIDVGYHARIIKIVSDFNVKAYKKYCKENNV